MKASELRIGNLVQDKQGNVKTISGADISEIDGFDDRLLIKPIILTEKWFSKLGFELFNGCYWIKQRIEFIEEEPGYWSRTSGFGSCEEQGISIQYVHQLQNLYFALTGKELEYEQN